MWTGEMYKVCRNYDCHWLRSDDFNNYFEQVSEILANFPSFSHSFFKQKFNDVW